MASSGAAQDVDMTPVFDALKSVLIPSEHGRLPADPYKTLVQSFLSSEFSSSMLLPDRSPPVVDSFPDRSDTLIEKLVSFGDCGGYGLKHLAKLISDSSVRRSGSVLTALKEALGNLKSEIKTRQIETVFIEVVSINNCVSEAMSQPLHHRFEVTVEAIVTNLKAGGDKPDAKDDDDDAPAETTQQGASFAECIMAFVRRIMEEAFQAEQSENILCAEIVAVTGSNDQNVQRIDVRNMKERRQQVLSILEAATVGEGEISMEIFLKVKHFMGNYNQDSAGHNSHSDTNVTEDSIGYMRILRRYRFSYCDNNTRFKRCFSRYPFESLARGVFFDSKLAMTYRDVYSKHLKKMNDTQKERAEQFGDKTKFDKYGVLKPMDDKLFTTVFFMMIKNIRKLLDTGEYVYAAEWMMQLAALMCPSKVNITLIIGRVSQLCSSEVGKLRSTRDALLSLRKVSSIVRNRIIDYLERKATEPVTSRGRISSGKVDKELLAIKTHYEAITSSTMELKVLILALLRTVHYSEFKYVSKGLDNELWALFTPDRRYPLANIHKDVVDINGGYSPKVGSFFADNLTVDELESMSNTLTTLESLYDSLECRLHVMECSMGLSVLLNLIRADRSKAELAGELDFKRMTEEREKEKEKFWIKGNFDIDEWNKRDIRHAIHAWNEAPRTVWELLGYIQSYYAARMALLAEGSSAQTRSVDMKIKWYLDMDQSNGMVGTFDWTDQQKGKDVDSLMKFTLFDPWTPQEGRGGKTLLQKEKYNGAKNADGTLRTLGMWDAESILRCAPGEFVLRDMIADEENRYDSPKFLATEASRIRYLVETHVIRALHESLYTALTSKDVGDTSRGLLPIYSSVSQSLFKFSAYLHLWNEVPSSTIAQYLFAPARVKGGIQYSEDCCGCAAIYTPYSPGPSKILKNISGAVFGPNRVLTGLGYRVQDIFVRSWIIPPIFSRMPQSPSSVTLHTYSGLTVTSGLQLGIPNYLTAMEDSKEQAFLVAVQEAKDAAGGKLMGKAYKRNEEALSYVKTPRMVGIEYPVTPLEIEVVLKYDCDFAAAESRARKSFGMEISKCVHFMASCAEWRVSNIAVAQKAGDTTCESDGCPRSTGKLVFTGQQIIEYRDYDTSMQAAASKFGFVSLECAVAMPEPKAAGSIAKKKETEMKSSLDDDNPDHAPPRAVDEDVDDEMLGDDIISLQMLTQALEKVVHTASEEESNGNSFYDPCVNDRQRICGGSGTVNDILQEYIQRRGFTKAFIPCRINFTMLITIPLQTGAGKEPENTGDSDDDSLPHQREKVQQNKRQGGRSLLNTVSDVKVQKLGNLSIGNEHLPRLLASTIWLSPHAAKGIWGCVQKSGEVETCYKVEFMKRKRFLDELRRNHLFAHAFEHRKVMSLLSTDYKTLVQCTRSNTSLAITFCKTVEIIHMCGNLLESGDVATLDVSSFRATMVKYVCCGLRLSILNPQCVHLRGGCHILLGNISRLEALLKLVPQPVKITKPVTVLSDRTHRITGQVVTNQEKSWDENELRKALGQPQIVKEASKLLHEMEARCKILLEALSLDVDSMLVQTTTDEAYAAQAYQILDTRDVVHSNEDKLQKMFQQTLDAHDVISDLSIFDSYGNIKLGNERKKMLRETSASSFGTEIDIADSDVLRTVIEKGTTAASLTGVPSMSTLDSEEMHSMEAVAYINQVKELLQDTDGMACVLADLDTPEHRETWFAREKEFAYTETGVALAAYAAEALLLANSAAERAAKTAVHGTRRVARLHGNLIDVDFKTDAVQSVEKGGFGGLGGAASKLNSVSKFRAAIQGVSKPMGFINALKGAGGKK